MNPSIQLHLLPHLTLTPQLQSAIHLLQLSSDDLHKEIQTAMEINPLLEMIEVVEKENAFAPALNEFSFYLPSYSPKEMPLNETVYNEYTSLHDYLVWQLNTTHLISHQFNFAKLIIETINEIGFLPLSLEELISIYEQLSLYQISLKEAQTILSTIQQFEPLGVGARSLKECLKIQLYVKPSTPEKYQALELIEHLDLLAKRDFARLKRRLGLNSLMLDKVIKLIQTLHPRPGNQIGTMPNFGIVPDVIAYEENNRWQVKLNAEYTPRLKINPTYIKHLKYKCSKTTQHSLNAYLQEARWWIKSLEQRHQTLLKVASLIVNLQADFLNQGPKAMRSLNMQEVAKRLGLHESTISRVTTQKYLSTPRGTFELKYFFTSQVQDSSTIAIQACLKKIIALEDRQKPLTDSKLMMLLAKEGLPVARRTVAKYRDALLIPASTARKQLLNP